MSDPLIGTIKIMPYVYAPRNYGYCNGALINVESNPQLYSLISLTYGGDGRTNFGLPDLRGRVPIHRNKNSNAGIYPAPIGAKQGTNTVTLTTSQIPSHTHTFQAATSEGSDPSPQNMLLAKENIYTTDTSENLAPLDQDTVQKSEGGMPHSNMMAYVGMNFFIALAGEYVKRP